MVKIMRKKLISMMTSKSAITKTQGIIIAVVIIIAAVVAGAYYALKPPVKGPVTIVFASPEWLPGVLTGEIAKGFADWSEKNLGYRVTVKMDLSPWGTYWDRLMTVFAAKAPDFDLLIADSQFMGALVEGGHIIKLNDWIKEHQGKDIDLFDFPPNLIKYYCSYPVWDFDEEKFKAGDLQLDTASYYGLPHEADTMNFVWRTDLFRHPDERAAFKAEYGYDLPQTYEDWYNWVTWLNFRDFAEFFTRKAGDTLAGETLTSDFYGCATWNGIYDSSAHTFHAYLYSAGGDIWDWKTRKVEGYINSPIALEALEWYVSLRAFEPPGSETYWFDECNTAMAGGKVAMIINCAGFLPLLFDPAKSVVYDKIEVTVLPGMVRPDGKFYRVTQLVGQPMTISTYSEHKEEALAFFIYWFLEENQWKWSDGGGGVASLRILNTERFIKAAPWNRADRDTIGTMKDFWNVPIYTELMLSEGRMLNAAYGGEITDLKKALDDLAAEQTAMLEEAGIL